MQLTRRLYETFCLAGVLIIATIFKSGTGYAIALLAVLFLIPFFSRDNRIKAIAFSIVLAFFAYCTWTLIITFYLTDFLYRTLIKADHSSWDFLAFLLPLIFAILTFRWSIKAREVGNQYELLYIIVSIIVITLFEMLQLFE